MTEKQDFIKRLKELIVKKENSGRPYFGKITKKARIELNELLKEGGIKVNIIESERGWGSKIDSVEYFETEELAKDYCKEYNKQNTATSAPDWYMRAELA